METSKKKMNVPDIDGLLVKISERKNEKSVTPKQSVQQVDKVNKKIFKSKTTKTLKSKSTVTPKVMGSNQRVAIGRPTVKKESVEYVKMSPRIPKSLKKKVDIALIHERFIDQDGNPIKTLDEIVAYALEKLLA